MSLTTGYVEELAASHLGAGAGMSLAVLEHGKPVLRHHTASAPELPVYSFTKTIIATLVLLSVSDHRLALDATLEGYVPDLPDGSLITLRQLLNHTAGLPDYGTLPAYQRAVAQGDAAWTFDAFADHTYRRGTLFPPGQGWSYSNPGYALLVRVLESAWRQPFEALVRERVAGPLELTHTRAISTLDDARICPARSRALHPRGQIREVKDHYDVGWVWHRLVVSDAADCARLLDTLLRQRWLGAELTRAMTDLVSVSERHEPWRQPSYGLGLMGEPEGERGAVYGHNGAGPGYSASAFYFPRSGISTAVIAAVEAPEGVLSMLLALHDAIAGGPPA